MLPYSWNNRSPLHEGMASICPGNRPLDVDKDPLLKLLGNHQDVDSIYFAHGIGNHNLLHVDMVGIRSNSIVGMENGDLHHNDVHHLGPRDNKASHF